MPSPYLGICCSPLQAEAAMNAGFDFVELPASQLPPLDPGWLEGIHVYSTNLFFPGGIRLFGVGAFDWHAYAAEIIAKAARFGVQVMVIGSGGQRRSAENQPVREAELAFAEIVTGIQEIARPYGVTIAPEALNHGETDVFNSPRALAQEMAKRNLAYTFDTFHAAIEGENDISHLPIHVHLAGEERLLPGPQDTVWLRNIRPLCETGYRGAFSLECREVAFDNNLREKQADIRRTLTSCWPS